MFRAARQWITWPSRQPRRRLRASTATAPWPPPVRPAPWSSARRGGPTRGSPTSSGTGTAAPCTTSSPPPSRRAPRIRFGPTVMPGWVEQVYRSATVGVSPIDSWSGGRRLYSITNQGVLCGTCDPPQGSSPLGDFGVVSPRLTGIVCAARSGRVLEVGSRRKVPGLMSLGSCAGARSEGGWRRGQCRGHFCLGLRPGVRSGAGRGRSCGWSLLPVWWLP